MSKKIVVISSSLRQISNSDILADEFIKGALEAGNYAEKISLRGKTIGFCKGCLACQTTQKCVIDDDVAEIAEKVKSADTVVFATPVYYYGLSGQLKTLLDRLNPLYSSDYSFRDIYLIGTAADSEKTALTGSITGLDGWITCFTKAKLSGVVYGVGVNECGEIRENKEVMKTAFEMGKRA